METQLKVMSVRGRGEEPRAEPGDVGGRPCPLRACWERRRGPGGWDGGGGGETTRALPTPEKTEAPETPGQEGRRCERSRQDEVAGVGGVRGHVACPSWVPLGRSSRVFLCASSGRAQSPSLSAWKDRPYPETESTRGGGSRGGGPQGTAIVSLGLGEPREGGGAVGGYPWGAGGEPSCRGLPGGVGAEERADTGAVSGQCVWAGSRSGSKPAQLQLQ